MLAVVVPRHLGIGLAATFKAKIIPWISRAENCADNANPGNLGLGALFGGAPDNDTALVEEWFGLLNGSQLATLRGNLKKMRTVLSHPQASVRIVDAPMLHHDRNYYAQVRVMSYHASKPTLSVEVANQWLPANIDTKVNTLFHELSHRILGTEDVGPPLYAETMYGQDNAQRLAREAPDHALINAENYGYFIALCNGFQDQAP